MSDKPKIYVVPSDAPMVPGRKLRDALIEAGHVSGAEHREAQRRLNDKYASLLDAAVPPAATRRSFIRTIGSIAWRLLVVMVVVGATVIVLAGDRS